MARNALPCIACGRELRNCSEDVTNQPSCGTAFTSHGHYGSTSYDPLDGHYLEINICDPCLIFHAERALEGRDKRPILKDGTVVGWEDVDWKLVPWRPKAKEVDWVVEQARKEFDLDAPE